MYLCSYEIVGTFNFADWDLRKAMTSGGAVRLFRYLIKLIDENTEQVFKLQREGKNVTQWKALINMEGFNLIQHGCASCELKCLLKMITN